MKQLTESGAEGVSNRRGFYQYTELEAENWEHLFEEHAWAVRELMNRYFPIDHADQSRSTQDRVDRDRA